MKEKRIELALDVVINSPDSLASLANPMHWSILIVLWKLIWNNSIKTSRKETRCNQIDVSLSVKNLSLSLMSTTHLQFLTGLVFQLHHNRYISESFLLCHWKWLTYLYNLYADAELNSTELLGQDHQCSSWKLLHISETVFLQKLKTHFGHCKTNQKWLISFQNSISKGFFLARKSLITDHDMNKSE